MVLRAGAHLSQRARHAAVEKIVHRAGIAKNGLPAWRMDVDIYPAGIQRQKQQKGGMPRAMQYVRVGSAHRTGHHPIAGGNDH